MNDKLRRLAQRYSSMTARPRLFLLEKRGGPAARPILHALRAALRGDGAPVFAEIEHARSLMLADEAPIVVADFGAGIGGKHADRERAKAGIDITKTVGEAARPSKSEFWCRFLYWLTSEMQPNAVLEFGTCVGISACYQGAALRDQSLTDARVITMEGSPSLADRSRKTIADLGLEAHVTVVCGRFADVLPSVLEDSGPFDLIFIDGHHDEVATIEYFEALRGHAASNAIVIFDDIRWTSGMRRAWKQVQVDDRVAISFDLGSLGICQLGEAAEGRTHLSVPLRGM